MGYRKSPRRFSTANGTPPHHDADEARDDRAGYQAEHSGDHEYGCSAERYADAYAEDKVEHQGPKPMPKIRLSRNHDAHYEEDARRHRCARRASRSSSKP